MATATNNGIVNKPSKHSVEQTVEALSNILKSKGVAVFALIDHSGEAEKVGLKMRPTKLLIFGNPKAGTPLMLASPSSAIDLPLKLLVWEDAQGKVWVSYNSPEYLRERHGLPQELMQNIAIIEGLATKAGEWIREHAAPFEQWMSTRRQLHKMSACRQLNNCWLAKMSARRQLREMSAAEMSDGPTICTFASSSRQK
jgi:uncharacterized protein (DUF302 family)